MNCPRILRVIDLKVDKLILSQTTMFTWIQQDFEYLNLDHVNGLYTYISPQVYIIRSVSDRNNDGSLVFTDVVYLITEYVHGATLFDPTICPLSLLSVHPCTHKLTGFCAVLLRTHVVISTLQFF